MYMCVCVYLRAREATMTMTMKLKLKRRIIFTISDGYDKIGVGDARSIFRNEI